MLSNKREMLVLFLGDVLLFVAALWVAIFLRNLMGPPFQHFSQHIIPFSILFAAWVLVFYIASLYEPHTVVLKSRIPAIILNVQAVNSLIAVLFFYLIPYFGITPKVVLFLCLLISFVFISAWRVFGTRFLGLRHKEKAAIFGEGEEMHELYRVVNDNPLYPLRFVTSVDLTKLDGIDFESEVLERILSEEVSVIVVDSKNEHIAPILPRLYNLIFSHIRFVDQYRIYEDIFDKIPLSLIGYSWFLENVSSRAHFGFDLFKRAMDIVLASALFILSLPLYPLIALGTAIFQSGPVFFRQERVGKGNHLMLLIKFRTMSTEDNADERTVTGYGEFLRKTRLDELPQLWNVLHGELSLIGPRPEIPELVHRYTTEIPYYSMRHLVTPGLSGWAQVHHDNHPHHHADVEETKQKLSYDLYYLKNRSLALDIKIALKTIKTLLSRTGI
ncbi:MAG: exopolysaccharide biosynthesis polyprenyl glycosylphosphotransferase [bacterium]|nr:exopolysaccharide biosynthesis polyprenyl glycosylphosphotransferase [bacterium]